MEEPGRDPLVLNETERRVLQELGRIESAAPNPRLARAYRRMVELARSDDELDGILAAHVARELLSALPGIIGITVPSERVDYLSRIGIIAASWPAVSRADQAPPWTSRLLRELLEDHEAASTRAREGSRGVMAWADPARAPYVPETSLDRWAELAKSGSGLAHRLRVAARELPAADTCRRHVDEVSALLFAIFAPYLAGIDEVDRLLETEDPTPETARALAALLTTPARYAYVFERIDVRWLDPLSSIARLLTIPPRLIERGDGYVQAPPWQQGRFLARVAASEPVAVEALVMRVPATDNPLAILGLVEIAQALPADAAARLVPSLASRMPVSLAIEYAALDAGGLVVQLAESGQAVEATELLAATVDAALRSRRDDHWHLEQLLDAPVTALAPRSEALGETLRARLRRCLRSRSGRHSTLWLRDIDRRPRYGLDAVWLVANALYRALVAGPLEPSKAVISTLLRDTKPVMRRTALAALTDRPDLTDAPDDLVGDPQGWDERSSTRSEYRRALGGLWELASDDARRSLLEYAESAAEAHEIIARSSDAEGQAEALIRRWRSHLLFAVRDRLPQEWLERCGPLEDVGDNRVAEPTATVDRSRRPGLRGRTRAAPR